MGGSLAGGQQGEGGGWPPLSYPSHKRPQCEALGEPGDICLHSQESLFFSPFFYLVSSLLTREGAVREWKATCSSEIASQSKRQRGLHAANGPARVATECTSESPQGEGRAADPKSLPGPHFAWDALQMAGLGSTPTGQVPAQSRW